MSTSLSPFRLADSKENGCGSIFTPRNLLIGEYAVRAVLLTQHPIAEIVIWEGRLVDCNVGTHAGNENE